MERDRYPAQLVSFLQHDLAMPEDAIAVALNHWQQDTEPFPMILWQYGLISLEQLSRVFDWFADQAVIASNSRLLERV